MAHDCSLPRHPVTGCFVSSGVRSSNKKTPTFYMKVGVFVNVKCEVLRQVVGYFHHITQLGFDVYAFGGDGG
jgi:hypothetical protein